MDRRKLHHLENCRTARKLVKVTDTQASVLSALNRIYTYRESISTGLSKEGGSLYILPSGIIGPCCVDEECMYRIKEATRSVRHDRTLIDVTLEVLLYVCMYVCMYACMYK